MNKSQRDKLIQAYRKEKDDKRIKRLNIICMVKIGDMSVTDVSELYAYDPHTITKWIRRYEEFGLEGLDDMPRTGRPLDVSLDMIKEIIDEKEIITPKELQMEIHKTCSVWYHITNIRKIMRKLGLSPKVAKRVNNGRANTDEIKWWQRNAKRQISRLKSRGFAIAIQDESLFVDESKTGTKYWSHVGIPVVTGYKGNKCKVVAYGAILADGRRFFRTAEKFDKETFLKYLKELVRRFKKVAVIMDNAPQHRARVVVDYIRSCPDIEVIWLPTATPELSAIEQYWNQSKRDLLVSEYYGTVSQFRKAISEYLRTTSTSLNVMSFVNRRSIDVKNF